MEIPLIYVAFGWEILGISRSRKNGVGE